MTIIEILEQENFRLIEESEHFVFAAALFTDYRTNLRLRDIEKLYKEGLKVIGIDANGIALLEKVGGAKYD